MPAGKAPLAFLAKKGWHTKNLRNVEKVWIAEQKEKAEAARMEELKKQIEEERQMDELRQLRTGANSTVNDRLDWMYEGPMAEAREEHATSAHLGTQEDDVNAKYGVRDEKEAEEYLLGREFKTKESSNAIKQLSENPGALWVNQRSVNDEFTRMHEDPLFLMKQQELAAKESAVKNPLKMHKVKQQIEAQLLAEREEKRRRKEEKKKKKEKKHKKHKKEKNSRRSPSPPSDGRRIREDSRERARNNRSGRSDDDVDRDGPKIARDRHRRSVSRSRSRERGREKDRDTSRGRKDDSRHTATHSRRRRRPSRSRSRSLERSRPADDRRRKHVGATDATATEMDTRDDAHRSSGGSDAKRAKYGLQSHTANTYSAEELGPSAAQIRKAEQSNAKPAAAPRNRGQVRKMTDEEVAKRLAEMQQDAHSHEEYRNERIRRDRAKAKTEEQVDREADPNFLKDMSKTVYLADSANMEERVKRNRHYHQRDLGSESFMRK